MRPEAGSQTGHADLGRSDIVENVTNIDSWRDTQAICILIIYHCCAQLPVKMNIIEGNTFNEVHGNYVCAFTITHAAVKTDISSTS